MLGDIAAPAVSDPDERGKLAYLLVRPRVRADERAEEFQGTLCLLLAELADEQLQPLPRCHVPSLTISTAHCRGPEVVRLRLSVLQTSHMLGRTATGDAHVPLQVLVVPRGHR